MNTESNEFRCECKLNRLLGKYICDDKNGFQIKLGDALYEIEPESNSSVKIKIICCVCGREKTIILSRNKEEENACGNA